MTAFLNDAPPPEGLALLCTPDGAIVRVVAATLEGVMVRDSLCASVDASSADACALFLRSVERGGLARSTPLRLGTRDVHCFGLRGADVVRIVAVLDPNTAAAFASSVDDFGEVAGEIRRTHSTYAVYEELARLNNDLVTAQRELARSVAELQRLNEWKDELLGIAAHDLRNPLNANAAFITFLLADASGFSDDALLLLDRLRSNSEYMLRLVDSVLDFAAVQGGHVRLEPEPASLADLVLDVVETMRIIAEGKEVAVHCRVDRALPPVAVDRVKMTQAVQNLISNAVQYSPAGGAVDVRLRGEERAIAIDVEDRGPGIPPGDLPHLFKPFTRLSTSRLSKQRSVGLGLAITKRLIEAHGGTIDVRSEVGKGSTFTLRLGYPRSSADGP